MFNTLKIVEKTLKTAQNAEICRMWDDFRGHILQNLPKNAEQILQAMSQPQYPSVRFNSSKFSETNQQGAAIPWEKNARQLQENRAFYLDPLWHAGAYYVQESSSMFLGKVIHNTISSLQFAGPLKVLDLCAAPGGKSTHILDIIPGDALLVSNEVISKRNAILRENIIRWGKPNVVITQNEASDFSVLENYFDIAVIDAPCSGEGLFRKDKKAIDEWSVENVEMCSHRQRDILQDIIPAVKENGFLMYSTCTFELLENEEQIAWLLQNGFETVSIDISSFPEIENGAIPGTYYFFPHKTSGSGFFICCLKKVKSHEPTTKRDTFKKQNRKNLSIEASRADVSAWMEQPEKFSILHTPYALHAFPINLTGHLQYLNQYLYITYFGTELGEMKKDVFIPAHALALSTIIKKDFSSYEAGKEDALLFLRKSPLSISSLGEPLGWKVVKYNGLNLGWVKALKDRINNYLPNNWRILH